KFFDTIKGTEVYGNYPMLRFYYSFCRHLSDDNNFDKEEFQADYLKLRGAAFQFDLHYAVYLADVGLLEEALTTLHSSKFSVDENILTHRIIYTRAANKEMEALELLKEHIELITEIDFKDIFNINNFFNLLVSDE